MCTEGGKGYAVHPGLILIVTFRNYTSSRIGIVSRAACVRRTGPGNCEVDGSGLGEAVVRGVGGDGYRDLSVHSGGRGVVVRCGGGSGIRRGEWNEQGVLLLVVVGWCGVLVSKDRTGQDRKWVWCCWRPALVARVGCGLWRCCGGICGDAGQFRGNIGQYRLRGCCH